MKLNNRTQNCAECEFMRMYDYGNRIYYCDHVDRSDDMGKLGVDHLPKTNPVWCPLRENKAEGEPNNMNMQYKIAKIVTKNQISDERIDIELAALSQEEWNEQCAVLDKMMKEHVESRKDKPAEEVMLQDLINVGVANNVSEATLWIAYLKWMEVEYSSR